MRNMSWDETTAEELFVIPPTLRYLDNSFEFSNKFVQSVFRPGGLVASSNLDRRPVTIEGELMADTRAALETIEREFKRAAIVPGLILRMDGDKYINLAALKDVQWSYRRASGRSFAYVRATWEAVDPFWYRWERQEVTATIEDADEVEVEVDDALAIWPVHPRIELTKTVDTAVDSVHLENETDAEGGHMGFADDLEKDKVAEFLCESAEVSVDEQNAIGDFDGRFIRLLPGVNNVALATPSLPLDQLGAWVYQGSLGSQAQIAFGDGVFVAGNQLGQMWTSADDGATWTNRGTPGDGSAIQAIVWTGTQFFARDNTGNALSSPTGTTWTNHGDVGNSIMTMAYADPYYIVGNSTGRIETSTNGTSWTLRIDVSGQLSQIAIGNGIILARGTSNVVQSNNGGTSWSDLGDKGNSYHMSFGSGLFVSCQSGLSTSVDGNTWTLREAGSSDTIEYGDGMFVVGGSAALATPAKTSLDGITWTSGHQFGSTPRFIRFGNGIFVASLDNGDIYTAARYTNPTPPSFDISIQYRERWL